MLGGKVTKEVPLTKTAFNIRDIPSSTWRIQAPSVSALVGTVLCTSYQRCQLNVISNGEYVAKKKDVRRSVGTRTPSANKSTVTASPVSINFFKRKRDQGDKEKAFVPPVNTVGTVPMATKKTTLASFDANGLLTRTKDESDIYRVTNVAKFLHSTRVDVMGVQETHIATEDQLWMVQKALGRYNYKTHCALNAGRGGVAVIYHMQRELISHVQIDERLLYVVLSDLDGIRFSFLVGHLHHSASPLAS